MANPEIDRLPGEGAEAPLLAVSEAVEEVPAFPDPLSLLRVTVLVPSTADSAAAEELVDDLELRGHQIKSVQPVDLTISERNIRFFHDEDRGEAARLAEAYDARLRDFTNFRPRPSEGTVEIWLAGDSSTVPQPVAQAAPGVQVQQVAPVPRIVIVQRQPSLIERLTGGLVSGHEGDGLPDASDSDSGSGVVAPAPDDAAGGADVVDPSGSDPDAGGGPSTGGTGTTTDTSVSTTSGGSTTGAGTSNGAGSSANGGSSTTTSGSDS